VRTVERIIGHPCATHHAGDGKIYVMNFNAEVSVVQSGDSTRHRSNAAISQGNLCVRTGAGRLALGK